MNTFKLTDHLDEVRAIASNQNISKETAAYAFITNLTTMTEHAKGTGTFNYHTMGQKWNSLRYTEKNEQRAALIKELQNEVIISTPNRRRSNSSRE